MASTSSRCGRGRERPDGVLYLLAWPDEKAKDAAWARFMADEEWKEIKRVTSAAHGDLVGAIEDRMLVPTAYSPSIPRPSRVDEAMLVEGRSERAPTPGGTERAATSRTLVHSSS
jgi:NIPSNAP protein